MDRKATTAAIASMAGNAKRILIDVIYMESHRGSNKNNRREPLGIWAKDTWCFRRYEIVYVASPVSRTQELRISKTRLNFGEPQG